MVTLSRNDILALVAYPDLIALLRDSYASRPAGPTRFHVNIESTNQDADRTLLLMPWWDREFLGVKIATIFPSNLQLNLPSVNASYLLSSSTTGVPLALMDGATLTQLRTAAIAGLASALLSRDNAHTLLMVGAGTLALPIIKAHSAVRSIERVLLWNRTPSSAFRLKDHAELAIPIEVVEDLDRAIPQADIISCATLSKSPLIKGKLVQPGAHVNLIGAYTPAMRESDGDLLTKSRIFVDTLGGVLKEGGDLISADAEGSWNISRIEGQLQDLCSLSGSTRQHDGEITVFKSVGSGIQDLVAAKLAYLKHIE